ncbi:4'-phosphopantetheinyl transferase superfamily protein [Atlantibacter subterranea]|jgi:enterobactin synthetase component D|uniref:Enterobactin synthase component D n=1 Tax=Atlantibacter subterraneus TaxID=255519 RepID=A0A427USJ1_9ENTR|nr:4'-phosphopantetheinyl transferase superfamily protein [Atlantibacter subterranea]MDA3134199.1 4'-phosphopantetheinyl transferase superfamily protein [Atlantibacter subterranea]RSB60819.1 4'-phosphopantetheinyl transferase superfamily protein [Atlantibacter subterranea]RSE03105.1 4'-phosphopantetheinyl transferase superfamily protein [Atlantibacter subterranea]RSE23521.1 4'-phosphopantetheinyl transferase superfamily protein [Atlantibacter subterranea]
MNTELTTLALNQRTLFCLRFTPDSFAAQDLLWLPHHPMLARAVMSRKAEHLAGRIAAVHALRHAGGPATPPGIGAHREPLWPAGFTGSITHAGNLALAAVKPTGERFSSLGIDYQPLLTANDAQKLADGVLSGDERARIQAASVPFHLALSQIFSAKESLFKALFPAVQNWFGFECAQAVALTSDTVTLELTCPLGPFPMGSRFTLGWLPFGDGIITLADL